MQNRSPYSQRETSCRFRLLFFLLILGMASLTACQTSDEPSVDDVATEPASALQVIETEEVGTTPERQLPVQATNPDAVETPVEPSATPETVDSAETAYPYPVPPQQQPIVSGDSYPVQVQAQPTRDPYPSPEDEVNVMATNTPDADVIFVAASQASDGTWTFNVTVEHPDTGWEDYADGWDVVLPDGTVLKVNDDPFTRLLLHPHETEQPFTRSQNGLEIPEDITTVSVRAHDIVDGFGGQQVIVDLTQSEGEGFTVQSP